MKNKIPNLPKLFLCEECEIYFFSNSKLEKPTHSKCAGHKTRIVTQKEIIELNKVNNLHLPLIMGEKQ